MNRAHAYKAAVDAAVAAGKADVDADVSMGVYSYPVLMAADIIAFSSDIVPVGRDQTQHVEMARDIAQKFNHAYGPVLTVPAVAVQKEVATIIGSDGRKMSKSYGNIVPLFGEPAELRKIIRRYKTDSSGLNEPKDPEASGLFQMYREIAPADDVARIRAGLESGELSWKELKDATFETLDAFLAEPRERYRELMADPARIQRVLREGAERARPDASTLLVKVRAAIGRQPLA
jgi:tryptophanyl-tRNA synthetase